MPRASTLTRSLGLLAVVFAISCGSKKPKIEPIPRTDRACLEGIEKPTLAVRIERVMCEQEVLCYDFENAKRLALFVAELIDYVEAVEASCRKE